jgi:DNA-directed RNA polymerase subunit omega
MAERRATLMTPRMEYLLERVDSKFTLVTLAAMRAREINDYYNQLGEGLGKIVPPQVTSVSRKPLSIAMEEIEVGKIESVPLPLEPEAAEDESGEAGSVEPVEPGGDVAGPGPALEAVAAAVDAAPDGA